MQRVPHITGYLTEHFEHDADGTLAGFRSDWDVREVSRRLSRDVSAFRGIDLDSVGSSGRTLIENAG